VIIWRFAGYWTNQALASRSGRTSPGTARGHEGSGRLVTMTKEDFTAVDAILRESIRNPVGPEFMAPPPGKFRSVA